jgi:hypothetical protein
MGYSGKAGEGWKNDLQPTQNRIPQGVLNAGLRIYAPQLPKYHRLILDGFLKARAKLARRLTKAGWFTLEGKSVCATPSGVIGDIGSSQILWGGKEDICATSPPTPPKPTTRFWVRLLRRSQPRETFRTSPNIPSRRELTPIMVSKV